MKITPLQTYILLKKYKKPEEKKLIINPNETNEFPFQGIVVQDCVLQVDWKAGTRVRYLPHTEHKMSDDLFLLKEESIIAIIEE